ncbi:hypothetical protein ACF0H5_010189 [Mactra antiquata]
MNYSIAFLLLSCSFLGCITAQGGPISVSFSPSTVSLNENSDSSQTISSLSCSAVCTCTVSGLVPGLFSYSASSTGGTIVKEGCSATSCGSCTSCSPCSPSSGCMTAPAGYTFTASCSHALNNTFTASASMTVTVTAETPTLTISLPSTASADNTMSDGRVIATASASSGPTIVQYVKETAVSSSPVLGTANIFEYNTANGEIHVNGDVSDEYSSDYTMRVCIESRRQESCATITISFAGCFETPNCDDQSDNTFSDQFTVGDTLFTMTSDPPSAHFSTYSSTWQNLSYSIVSNTLSVASLNSVTGAITTTGNITVWPDYPHSIHSIVVKVANLGYSCNYYSTCTMSMQIAFTNWPIRFENMPNSASIHEDSDGGRCLHDIITYDYNDPTQDNVTCTVVYNENDTLLYLYHNGSHQYDSYSICKHSCSDPGCGFICTANGCMNYDLDNQFIITINCADAYGSSVTESFTLNIQENQPPVWTNVPTTRVYDTDKVSHLDVLFSIYYTDAENEVLDYNYTFTPDNPTPPLFGTDAVGNYHASPANITALVYFWDQVNSSYLIDFCGTERRNMVCSTVTLDIQEYCGPTPTCNDGSVTVTDQFTQGDELLVIDLVAAPAGLDYTSITYIIAAATPGLFSVDRNSGSVTTSAPLSVTSPPSPQTHLLLARVYDTAACEVGACTLSITVTFTNFDISITNMGSVSIDLHEDHTTEVTLHTIMTSDANDNDGVNCYVDIANSVPNTDTGIFRVEETDYGSNVFEIISKELPGFDYSVQPDYTIAVICEDKYNSTDSASMVVNILENQEPTINNLATGDVIVVDPMSYFNGDIIFTLRTSDAENDPLVYSCIVDNSFVPIHCASDGVVSLRRNVLVPDEDGVIYNITLCINETVHNHTQCETLNVNFTSSRTNPELNNLPANVSFPEDTVAGTIIYNVTVYDPDVGDIHIFTMNVYPSTNLFNFDRNSGILTLRYDLNYENVDTYWFVFSVQDAYLPGLEEKTLTVNITDINETPTLQLGQSAFTTIEANAGFVIDTIPFTCTDPDNGQNMTLSITSGTHASYFTLNNTSTLSFIQDWDFESGSLPESTTLQLTCDDGNGLSDVAHIVVNINRVNEFAPDLTYTDNVNITIYNNQTLLDSLLTVSATDSDYGDDGVFNFQIIGDGIGVQYFTLRGSADVQNLYISNYITWNYNYTFVFTVEVSDGETEALTSSFNVTVTYIAPAYVLPTKPPRKCLLCTTTGIALVALLCSESFLILIMTCHVFKRMRIWEICRLKPKVRQPSTTDNKRRKRVVHDDDGDDDNYRPHSEMLHRALPKTHVPTRSLYSPPVSVMKQPPPVPKYESPDSAISLANVPDPTQPRADNLVRNNVVTPTNVTFFHPIDDVNVRSKNALAPNNPKRRRRHNPSLFQNPGNAPPGVVDPSGLFYRPTKKPDDYIMTPNNNNDNRSAVMMTLNPMFGEHDYNDLYGDEPLGPVNEALDF